MRAKSKLLALLGIGLMGAQLPCAAQNPQTMPGMQHEHGSMARHNPAIRAWAANKSIRHLRAHAGGSSARGDCV